MEPPGECPAVLRSAFDSLRSPFADRQVPQVRDSRPHVRAFGPAIVTRNNPNSASRIFHVSIPATRGTSAVKARTAAMAKAPRILPDLRFIGEQGMTVASRKKKGRS